MQDTQAAEVVKISLEKKMETELVKRNVTEAVLSSLEAKYSGMKLKGVEDKESYLELKAAAKECSTVRNIAVKVCKEGREEAVKVQKQWVAKEKEVVGRIADVEDPLYAEMKLFEDEVERKRNEERKRQEEAYMQRTQALTKMGATYSNETFTLGEFAMEANLVKESSQEVWEEKMLPSFTAEYQKIEAERIEQQRIETERKEQERKDREEFERKQKKFADQQAAFKKQQEDAERVDREKRLAEEREKREEAQRLQKERFELMYPHNPTGADMDMATLWVLAESDFQEKLAAKKIQFKQYQEEKQKAIEEAAAGKERLRIEIQQKEDNIRREQEEIRKVEELAKAGDKAQWGHFIAQVSKITVPAVKSGQYRKIAAIAKEKLEEIINL